MADQAKVKGHCPKCNAERNAEAVAQYEVNWDDPGSGVWGRISHRILQCLGCDEVFHQTVSICSEEYDEEYDPKTGQSVARLAPTIAHWPSPTTRSKPDWLWQVGWNADNTLGMLLDDVYTALDNDLGVFAVIGLRTIFDRSSELLKVDQSKTFAQKLDELVSKGKISPHERELLDALTECESACKKDPRWG
jgi:hypothetical protein